MKLKIFLYKWWYGQCRHFCILCKYKKFCSKQELIESYYAMKGIEK